MIGEKGKEDIGQERNEIESIPYLQDVNLCEGTLNQLMSFW